MRHYTLNIVAKSATKIRI